MMFWIGLGRVDLIYARNITTPPTVLAGKTTLMDSYEEIGKALLEGKRLERFELNGKTFIFNYSKEEFIDIALKSGWPRDFAEERAEIYESSKVDGFSVQSRFISDLKSDYCLNSGGYGSGKSIALYVKLILFCMCFPGNRVLLGRKTMADIDRAILPELFDLMPSSWYTHRVKDGLINFKNGSQIILFGLEAMQSGSVADIKKAQQKLKSLNLGAYFIDQLEEVELSVVDTLNSRLRRKEVPLRQGNSDCNPANFWAYFQFKLKQRQEDNQWVPDPDNNSALYESSMLHNPQLPWDYIRKQLSMEDSYRKRFVYGEWTTDVLLKGTVFSKENIQKLETMARPPREVREGCEIFEDPSPSEIYQIGVDPSEGVVDPSSISVVSGNGREVAKFNGYVTIPELADKIKFLHYNYNKGLIIPEVNRSSILEHIKDLRVYRRRQMDYKEKRETEKLGFVTSWSSKEALITHFQQLLRQGVPKIYHRKTIEEMKAFVWSDEASRQGASASPGFHDDNLMATLLAFHDFNPKRVEEIKVARSRPHPKKKFQYS
jgi:hypothetical protein